LDPIKQIAELLSPPLFNESFESFLKHGEMFSGKKHNTPKGNYQVA